MPYTIDDLWKALVDPDAVRQWFGAWSIDPQEGGDIQLGFGETIVPRSIRTISPPHTLAYTWEQDGEAPSLVQYDLLRVGDSQTLLTVSQEPLEARITVDVAPGWHSMMDRLSTYLVTRTLAAQDKDGWAQLYAPYEAKLASA